MEKVKNTQKSISKSLINLNILSENKNNQVKDNENSKTILKGLSVLHQPSTSFELEDVEISNEFKEKELLRVRRTSYSANCSPLVVRSPINQIATLKTFATMNSSTSSSEGFSSTGSEVLSQSEPFEEELSSRGKMVQFDEAALEPYANNPLFTENEGFSVPFGLYPRQNKKFHQRFPDIQHSENVINSVAGSDVISKLFSKTFAPEEQLQESRTQNYNIDSLLFCSSLAMRVQWPTMFCIEENQCVLSDLQLKPMSKEPSQTNSRKCYTVFSKMDCQLDSYSVVEDGWEGLFCDSAKCSKGVLDPSIFHPPAVISCPAGYTEYEGFGCVRLYKEELIWCEAKLRCKQDGGDLAEIDGINNKDNIQAFFDAEGASANNDIIMWIGLEKKKEKFVFSLSGKLVKNDSPSWNEGNPDLKGWACVLLRSKDLHMLDKECSGSKEAFALCEIPM